MLYFRITFSWHLLFQDIQVGKAALLMWFLKISTSLKLNLMHTLTEKGSSEQQWNNMQNFLAISRGRQTPHLSSRELGIKYLSVPGAGWHKTLPRAGARCQRSFPSPLRVLASKRKTLKRLEPWQQNISETSTPPSKVISSMKRILTHVEEKMGVCPFYYFRVVLRSEVNFKIAGW